MSTPGIQISAFPVSQALTGNELMAGCLVGVISSITNANIAVITINNETSLNPFQAGMTVSIQAVAGMSQINGQGAVVSAVGGVSGAWTITVPINTSSFGAYTSGGTITSTVSVPLLSMRLSAGLYQPAFLFGPIQFAGPGGVVTGDNNFGVGKNLPNPSGVPGPALFLGSGGGLGVNVSFWILQDQAFDVNTPGNDLNITAGEVQPNSTQRGGNIWSIAGAADLGTLGGGSNTVQGGTGARSPGGIAVLQGGNNTDLNHPPGDAFAIAGETGSQGANVHIAGTIINGIPGVIHGVRFNSTFVTDYFSDGRIYSYPSNGFGTPMAPWISRGSSSGQAAGWAGPSEVATHVEVINGKTFTWVNGLLQSVV